MSARTAHEMCVEHGITRERLEKALAANDNWGKMVHAYEFLTVASAVLATWPDEPDATAYVTLVDGTRYTVDPAPHEDGRRHWRYTITDAVGTVLATGTDLSTTADDPEEALTSLLGFLSAFLESTPGGENADLFPDTCRALDADLIAIAVAEREETE